MFDPILTLTIFSTGFAVFFGLAGILEYMADRRHDARTFARRARR